MPKFSTQTIHSFTADLLVKYGAKAWIADEVAKAVTEAEAYGNVICGLYYLESYCIQLRSGRVDGQIDPLIHIPKPGAVFVDARFGFAQAAFSYAKPKILEAVRQNATASLAVAHAHTCTSLGYFTAQIAQEGYICIGFTNASSIVAPPGGATPIIGTNPIAMSVPDNKGGLALHFDFSTAAVALGKITMAKAAGEKIPLGWAVDKNGAPTSDPTKALEGALVSAADYKGWALGLMVEILVAGVTGSVNSLDVKALKAANGKPHGLGQFYLIVDPKAHHDEFYNRLKRLQDAVDQEACARLPGQNRRKQTHITVPKTLWEKLQQLYHKTHP